MNSFRGIISPRAGIVSALVTAALLFVLLSTPFSGMYLFGVIIFLFPLWLQLVLCTAGLLPATLSLGMVVFGAYYVFGVKAALATAGYLLPLLLLVAIVLTLELEHRRAMLVLTLGYALVVILLYMAAIRLVSPDPFALLTKTAVDALQAMEGRDSFLNTLWRYGLLSLPPDIATQPLVPAAVGYTFSPQALAEFSKQVSLRVDLWLRALLPTLLSSYSITWGVGGLQLAMHHGRRHVQRRAYFAKDQLLPESILPTLGLPPFSKWYLPANVGRLLFAMAVAGLLARLSRSDALSLAGQMMYNVPAALFGLQGLSLLNHLQKQRDMRPAMRGMVMALLYLVLPVACMLLGVYDQTSNIRKLRSTQDKNDTPGRNEP